MEETQQKQEDTGGTEQSPEQTTTSTSVPETPQIISMEAVSVTDPSLPPTEVQQFEELLTRTKSSDIDPFDSDEVCLHIINVFFRIR